MAWNDAPPSEEELKAIPAPKAGASDWATSAPTADELKSLSISEDPTETESFLRQAAGGGSFGLDDEIIGGLNAAGRVAGVKNLGTWTPFGNAHPIEFGSPTISPDDLKKAYVEGRDSTRADQHQDYKVNPGASTAGFLTGALLGPGSAASAETLGGKLGLGALQGGAVGFGTSEADSPMGVAADTALGAGTGALASGVVHAAAPYAEKAANFIGQKASGAIEGAVSKIGQVANRIPEGVKDVAGDIAGKAASSALGGAIGYGLGGTKGGYAGLVIGGAADKGVKQAFNAMLGKVGSFAPKQVFDPFIHQVTDRTINTEAAKSFAQSIVHSPALQRAGQILMNAAARGPKAVAAAHFVLQQQDPAYQQVVAKMNETGNDE